MPPTLRRSSPPHAHARGEEGSAAHIARVAARLFAAEGYDATPVRKIVEAAGVTKPTLYYHFGSKAGLARALLTDPLDALVAAMRQTLDEQPDPIAALGDLIERNLAFSRDEPDRARFLYALIFGPSGEGLADEVGRICGSFDVLWTEMAERLVAANAIDGARVEGFLAMTRGAIVVRTVDYVYRGGELGPDQAGRLVTDLLDGFGLGPRQATNARTRS